MRSLPFEAPPSAGLHLPQLCPVSCCPSRQGKEAQDWTTKQGLKNQVEMEYVQPAPETPQLQNIDNVFKVLVVHVEQVPRPIVEITLWLHGGGAASQTMADGQLPSHLSSLLLTQFHQGQPCCPQVSPDLQQPWLQMHRTTLYTTLRLSSHRASPAEDTHPEGRRPRSLGRLPSGFLVRGHLQQRHSCLDGPLVPTEVGSPPGTRGQIKLQTLLSRHAKTV